MWAKEGEGQWKGQKETEVSETLCEFDELAFLGSKKYTTNYRKPNRSKRENGDSEESMSRTDQKSDFHPEEPAQATLILPPQVALQPPPLPH